MEEYDEINILDVLLDEENTAPIILVDEDGRKLSFEQIAVIPYKGATLYCVLKPLDEIENVGKDEAIVFKVVEEDGETPKLVVETDEKLAIEVFHQYYDLLEKSLKK